MFQRFCDASMVENRQRSGRSSKITEEQIEEVHHGTPTIDK